MSLYQLFTRSSWWGKLIGAFFGFLIAGPAGALFGVMIGNFFDRGLKLHFSHPYWHYHSEKNSEIRRIFLETMFATLGRLAKADGHVSTQDIEYANDIMAQMKLNATQINLAQHWFSQGKSLQFNLELKLHSMYKVIHKKPFLLRLFIDTQYRFVKEGQLTEKKIAILNIVFSQLNLAPLYQHGAFARDFPWYFSWQQQQHQHQHQTYQNQHQSRYQQQPPPRHHSGLDDPYAILNVKPGAIHAEVKRAYRRQISHHHPDKLIAKGASASVIKAATEKTQKIRKAYDDICLQRGW
ncbi:MAG: co-chaperone DjlA [Legionellales bacterium]|nr:co-chaperone DjlA [Legionellales bacterium]